MSELAEALLGRLEVWIRTNLFRAVWRHTLKVGFPAEFQDHVESWIGEARERSEDLPTTGGGREGEA